MVLFDSPNCGAMIKEDCRHGDDQVELKQMIIMIMRTRVCGCIVDFPTGEQQQQLLSYSPKPLCSSTFIQTHPSPTLYTHSSSQQTASDSSSGLKFSSCRLPAQKLCTPSSYALFPQSPSSRLPTSLSPALAVVLRLQFQQWWCFVVLFVTLLQNMTSFILDDKLMFLIAHIILIDYQSTMTRSISEDSPSLEDLKLPPNPSSTSAHTEDELKCPKQHSVRKISDEQKERLVRLITVENYNMKDAAKIVKISYSTAKKVFTRFRRALREKTQPTRAVLVCKGQAGFREVGCGRVGLLGEVRVVSTIAGKEQIRSHNIILIGKSEC